MSHGTGLLFQLGSDFLEEPGCSIGEGSVARIARFGIAAEAAILTEEQLPRGVGEMDPVLRSSATLCGAPSRGV